MYVTSVEVFFFVEQYGGRAKFIFSFGMLKIRAVISQSV